MKPLGIIIPEGTEAKKDLSNVYWKGMRKCIKRSQANYEKVQEMT